MLGLLSNNFFKTERTHSEVKSELLPRVFEIFVTSLLLESNVTIPVLCLDMLAGLDALSPTPAVAKWLRKVYSTTKSLLDLNQSSQSVLYDADNAVLAELQAQVKNLPFYEGLIHPPLVLYNEAGMAGFQELQEEASYQQVIFLNPFTDPFSQEVLGRALTEGQANLFMLLTFEDMQRALKKAKPSDPVSGIFGDRIAQVRDFQKKHKRADKREAYVMSSFGQLFEESGYYTCQFKVNYPDQAKTNAYLLFSTKSTAAYLRLKELLERYSDYQEDGVPLFGADLQQHQTALFHEYYTYSIANLVQELSQKAAEFSNRTVQYVYEQHSIGTHYTLANYQAAYDKLMRQGIVRFINPKTGQPITKLTPASLIRYKK